jgi:2,3-dihydro-2,3-dihydroxybenzoate dehydrogenase
VGIPGQLAGRRAMVTGAAAGIGRAAALALAGEGVAIEAVDRDAVGLAVLVEAVRAAGGRARSWVVDLSHREEVEPLVDRVEREAGPIDLLVNVAGIGLHAPVLRMTPDDLRCLFEVNFFAAAALCREALRAMSARRRGHIINVSSAAARRGLPGLSAYAATKAALHTFTQTLRLEARHHGVAVTELLPISTRTGFFQAATNRAARPYTPAGWVQTPEYVAKRIVACARRPVAELHTIPLLRPLFALEALAPNLVERLAAWFYQRGTEDLMR